MAQELKVALVQSSLVWENPKQNRINFAEKINSISSDVGLIILPEMFTTGFTMTPENLDKGEGQLTLEWMQQIAKDKVKPSGNCHHYDKRHTFTLAGEHKVYKAGSERLTLEYKGFRICPMVCYDLRFPVWARNTDNYDVLIYVANWPKPRIAAWDTLLKARAIENMSYCIGVNRIGTDETGHQYSGHSAVYDCLGRQEAFTDKEEIGYATLSKEHIDITRDKLKFLADRDDFNLLL